jgi:hypothetical protein
MRPFTLIVTATATVVTQISRTTTACDVHGPISSVHPYEGQVVDRGSYMSVVLYDITFEDGVRRTYWMCGGEPKVVKGWRS